MAAPPLIVAVEGPDNAGKSTLCASLAATLPREHALRVCVLRSVDFARPTGPALRAAMARVQAAPSRDAYRRLHLLFLANRLEAFAHAPPAARAADVVLFDRYTLSGLVYAALDGVGALVADIETALGTPADLTLLLDLPPEAAEARATFGDGFRESRAFQAASTRAFRHHPTDYAPAGTVHVLDATQPAAAVLAQAVARILAQRPARPPPSADPETTQI